MEELKQITDRYNPDYVRVGLETLDSLKRFSLVFFKDVAEIYDCLTRLKNVECNLSGFFPGGRADSRPARPHRQAAQGGVSVL